MLHFTSRSMTRLGLLASMMCSIAGCPASTTLPGDDAGRDGGGGALDGGGVVDGGGTDAGERVDVGAADTGTGPDSGMCEGPAFRCLNDVGGGCCGTEETSPICGAGGGLTCPSGFVAEPTCATGCATDWRSCGQSSECVLTQNDCCGWCGEGHFSDVDAVNEAFLDEHALEVCPEPMPCPLCPGGPLDPQVIAVCRASTCTAIDLGTDPSTECAEAADCEATYGNCCGCSGTDDEVIAVSTAAGRSAVDTLFCGGGFCPLDCAAVEPPGWGASCEAGRCVPVRIAP
jgi:hypothetical protein